MAKSNYETHRTTRSNQADKQHYNLIVFSCCFYFSLMIFFLASKKAMKQLLCKNEIILQLFVAVGTVALGQNQ